MRQALESPFHEHRGRITGGESLLSDPRSRPRLRRHTSAHGHPGGNQPASQRLRRRYSDFWLLTPDFHIPKGYQGRSPWLVSAGIKTTAAIFAGFGVLWSAGVLACTHVTAAASGQRQFPSTRFRNVARSA